MIQDVSTFYWWAILLRLPKPISYSSPKDLAAMAAGIEAIEGIDDDGALDELILDFASDGFARDQAAENLWSSLLEP